MSSCEVEMCPGSPARRLLYVGDSLLSNYKRLGNHRTFSSFVDERCQYERGSHTGSFYLVRHGAVTGEFLERVQALNNRKFEHAFLLLGPNDSSNRQPISKGQFVEGLALLIKTLQQVAEHLYYIIPPHRQSANHRTPSEYHDAGKEHASQLCDISVVDMQPDHTSSANHMLLHSDGYHLNHLAHLLIAKSLLQEMNLYQPSQSEVCRLIDRETKQYSESGGSYF